MPAFEHFSYSMLSEYQTCQRKFYYRYIRKLETRQRQFALEFGSAWHEALTVWTRTRELTEAVNAFNAAYEDSLEEPLRTRALGAKMLREYSQKYPTELFEVVGQEERGEFKAGQFLFVFRTDARLKWDGMPTLMERKTTSRLSYGFFNRFKPNLQVSIYVMGAREVYGEDYRNVLIDAAWVGKTQPTGGEKFVRDVTSRSPEECEEAKQIVVALAQEITGKQRFEEFVPNFEACTQYGECIFRRICGAPPDVRERLIQAEFVEDNRRIVPAVPTTEEGGA